MLVLIPVHSFASFMEKPSKHIALLVIALLICCNSLLANVSTQAVSTAPFLAITAANFSNFQSSKAVENVYSKNNSSGDQFVKNEFLSENDEDDTERFSSKKISTLINVACSYHKQRLQLILPLPKSCTSALHPIFFQSKTASSLYLIFEVFRI